MWTPLKAIKLKPDSHFLYFQLLSFLKDLVTDSRLLYKYSFYLLFSTWST